MLKLNLLEKLADLDDDDADDANLRPATCVCNLTVLNMMVMDC